MKKYMASAVIAAALTITLAPASVAQDEWEFGVGTGFFGLNIDGDMGLTTGVGPVDLDASMDSDEVREVLDSAFGLGGYAAKGKWVLQYAAGRLELEDTLKGTGSMGNPVTASASFAGTAAEFAAAYRFALTGKHAWGVLGGLRYTKHEYDFGVKIDSAPPAPPATLKRNIDEGWTDVLVGLTHGTQLGEKWTWGNRLDAGFGGSEGTYFFNSGFNWQFAESWVLGFYGQITSIEFENDDRGDPDWYLYDADEFGLGFNILYKF